MSFFFFKQKTAYEVRISYWSSDVCSSDLSAKKSMERPLGWPANSGFLLPAISAPTLRNTPRTISAATASQSPSSHKAMSFMRMRPLVVESGVAECRSRLSATYIGQSSAKIAQWKNLIAPETGWRSPRSEEHTSELQSLMRISYADFRLQ